MYLREVFFCMGNKGGKIFMKVKCPRCRKGGTLRLKQKGKNSVIVYHYDSKQYRESGGSGTVSHHIGSLKDSSIEMLGRYLKYDKWQSEFKNFDTALKNLKDESISESDIQKLNTDNTLSKFSAILYELKKIKKIEESKKKKLRDERLEWCIKCPSCKDKISLHAKFTRVLNSQIDDIHNRPRTHIYYKSVKADN